MITLQAPFINPVGVINLPNPELGDSIGPDTDILIYKTMHNITRTYTKSSGELLIQYSFSRVGAGKIEELKQFLNLYIGEEFRLIDYNDIAYKVKLVENEIVISWESKEPSGDCYDIAGSGSFNLSFSGRKI